MPKTDQKTVMSHIILTIFDRFGQQGWGGYYMLNWVFLFCSDDFGIKDVYTSL